MLRFLLPLALVATTSAQSFGPGAVYTLTNSATGNAVAVALRTPGGSLVPLAQFATGGTGTGAGLGSQGALASSDDGRFLVVVNPGSDDLTLFSTFANVLLARRDVTSSHGDRPTSIAIHGDDVVALNADSDALARFRIEHGRLRFVESVGLSQAGAAAAQVGFDPSGRFVVVTERATDRIVVFPRGADGSLGAPIANPSAGPTPFGFAFRDDGVLVVSEAAGGAPLASRTSSYRLRRDGSLTTLTASLPADQTAACWIVLPRNGAFAYTTNTGSGSLTGYSIDARGRLTRLDASGATGRLGAGARPIDASFDRTGRVVFVLDSGNDQIVALRRGRDGALALLGGGWHLPDGAAGVVAR